MRLKLMREVSASRIRRGHRFISGLLAIAALAILIMLLATAGCTAGPTEIREDNFTVGGTPRLVVNSENGSIQVNVGSGTEVHVKATLRGTDRLKYEVKQDGDTITVSVQVNKPWFVIGQSPGADIAITAPDVDSVKLETSNGYIELHGIEGEGILRTSNGRLVLDNVKGDFEGRTSNGSIEVNTMEGMAVLETTNGPVEMREVAGEFDVETSNGRISFTGNMTAGGSNRLVTSNGSVYVELKGPPSVSLDAKTSNGKVTSKPPILATVTKEEHLVGKIGQGETDLYIRTSNGDVTIK